MAGLFSNPANWELVDTLQGQEGGINPVKAAIKYTSPGAYVGDVVKDNFTGVLGTNTTSPSAVEGAMSYNPDGTVSKYINGQWVVQRESANTPQDESASTSGTSGSTPSYSSEDLAYLDNQMGLLRGMYNNIDVSRQQGEAALEDSYNKEVSGANLSRGRAIEDLNTKETDTGRQKDQAIGKVDTYARTLADSVRRRLGIASGSDSSAYQIAAPGAVARDASGKRTGVLEDYGVNFRNLDTTKKRAGEDYDGLLKELEAQRNQRKSSLYGDLEGQKQQLDSQMGSLAGERAKLLGGGYGAQRVAQQPYLDQYNQRQGTINSLFDQYRTPYSVKAVEVKAPTLRDYMVDRTKIAGSTQAQDQYAPYNNYLKKDEEEATY